MKQLAGPAKRSLALLLAAQIALGVLYSFATPVFEASDELWHFPVVRELVVNRRLPVQDPAIEQPWAQEGSQPPLYYLAGAALTAGVDTSDYARIAQRNPFPAIGVPGASANLNLMAHPPGQSPAQGGTVLAVYLIRWLSVLLVTATTWLTWRLAQAVTPARPAVALLSAALVAFNPMVLFIGASVNNDNLLMALTSLALLLLVRDVESDAAGLRWKSTLILGVTLAAAALTKLSGLMLLPVAALALTLQAACTRNWRTWLARGAVLAVVVLAISGWWYARNVALYGELTGIQRMVAIAGPRPAGFGLTSLLAEWKSFWYSYWGVFGAFNILAPPWFYALTGALSLAAAGGLLLTLIRLARRRTLPARWRSHALLLSFLALTAVGLVRWTLLTPASQGRLLFGGAAALALYLAVGVLAWLPAAWQSWCSRGLTTLLAIVAAVIPLSTILPAYRPALPIAALPPDAVALDVVCGEGIALAGYRLENETTLAGQPLAVTLFWTTDRPQTDDLALSINAYGFQEQPVGKLDSWPGGGLRPTTLWEPGRLYADRVLLATDPASATPTLVRLGISWDRDLLHPSEATSVLCTVDQTPVDAIFLDGGALVTTAPAPSNVAPIATLQHGIQLLATEAVQGDGQLRVRLDWTTSQAAPGDYTVFVHLFDAAGAKVAQGDAAPRGGYWPTSRWRPGETVESIHALELPPDLPAGQYTLGVGMYDPATGERLAASNAAGVEWRDRMIVLASTINLP